MALKSVGKHCEEGKEVQDGAEQSMKTPGGSKCALSFQAKMSHMLESGEHIQVTPPQGYAKKMRSSRKLVASRGFTSDWRSQLILWCYRDLSYNVSLSALGTGFPKYLFVEAVYMKESAPQMVSSRKWVDNISSCAHG